MEWKNIDSQIDGQTGKGQKNKQINRRERIMQTNMWIDRKVIDKLKQMDRQIDCKKDWMIDGRL